VALTLTPEVKEITITPTEYVALIRIEGPIAYRTQGYTIFTQPIGVETTIELIEEARTDPSVKSVILYINSPGGTATASEALYYAVKKLSEEKPVVAYIAEYGTSGAYMAALPADTIIASESSFTGAIGVYSIIISYKGLLDKLGIEVYTFKSGKLKDIGSPYRNMTEEDAEVFEEIVSELFTIFKNRVEEHRDIKDEKVYTGRPFLAKQALELGLIDDIGTLDDAKKKARELAGLPEEAPIKELEPPRPSLFETLFGLSSQSNLKILPSYEILCIWPPPAVIIKT